MHVSQNNYILEIDTTRQIRSCCSRSYSQNYNALLDGSVANCLDNARQMVTSTSDLAKYINVQ